MLRVPATACAQAIRLDKELAVAHYGMAQMYLAQGEPNLMNAVSELEHVLTAQPGCLDALKVRR